ncbi:hypothetical protein LTR84_012330 [Exophiala bonariae]|uniref:Uncharacterized protein n=1 Tax=Exophiala bonariae TaxID=1690606 RepID=A0AAV9NIC0_9EURO|nr:hypothetical protein LTR84_012330 [Exophiala bonariae]
MALQSQYVFTLYVDLAPALDFGKTTSSGNRRFIPITGGRLEGPNLKGEILPGGGDWNAVRADGVVHVLAKYAIRLEDGTMVNVHNEGYGRASQTVMEGVFSGQPGGAVPEGSEWYTKTWPRFEVADNTKHAWMCRTCFVGNLLKPEGPGHVQIEVFELL